MKRKLLLAAVGILTFSIDLAAEKWPGWAERELQKIEEAAQFGFPGYTQWFYLRGAFSDHSDGEAVSQASKTLYQELLQAISTKGMAVWGAAGVWNFPEASAAPRLPANPNVPSTVRLTTSNCIPSFDSVEYLKWSQVRNGMHATIVREFPEIEVWWVGTEPDLLFYSCDRRGLSRGEYVRFALDSLEGVREAVKLENPEVQIGFYFLGLGDEPIRFREDGRIAVVQPADLLEDLAMEARGRGYDLFDAVDVFASDLNPSLLEPRQNEQYVAVTFGQTAMSGSSGWQTKFLEEFNTNASNLVASYHHWQDIRTAPEVAELTLVEVASGKALLRLKEPDDENVPWTLAGAVTVNEAEDSQNGVDVVPDEDWGNIGSECCRWTAVSDWSGIPPGLDPPGAHGAVFLRVNSRTYDAAFDDQENEVCSGECPDQTRFGTWISGGAELTSQEPCTSGSSGSQGDHLAVLQFQGDDKEDSSVGLQWRCEFGISENPFDSENQNEEYRVQIIERKSQVYPFPVPTQLRWRAEVWSTASPGSPIGWTTWISEITVRAEGVEIPELGSSQQGESKLMFAVGPGKDDGGIDVERTGSAYWVY